MDFTFVDGDSTDFDSETYIKIDFSDGLVLVGLFLFWQLFHIFDILKHNVLRKRSFPKSIIFDFALVMASGFAVYYSIERLVA